MVEYIEIITDKFYSPEFWLYDNRTITKSLVIMYLGAAIYLVGTTFIQSFYYDLKKKYISIPGLPMFIQYKTKDAKYRMVSDRTLAGDMIMAYTIVGITFFVAMGTQKIGVIIIALILIRQLLVVLVKLFTGEPEEKEAIVPCEIDKKKYKYLRKLLEEEEEECTVDDRHDHKINYRKI